MPTKPFSGVIFDMDGTLVEPLLDFAQIRRELGIEPRTGILEAIDLMSPAAQLEARTRLVEIELAAAMRATLIPNAVEVVTAVRQAGLKTALLTRNAAEAMRMILERFPGLVFDLAWSREDGPIKPQPDGVLAACRQLSLLPQHTACVGDYHYDILAANAAGAYSVLLAVPDRPRPPFADEAHAVIADLCELLPILGL